jgi:hypothetical protein
MKRGAFLFLSGAAPFASVLPARAATMPDQLLGWAQSLVDELSPENNVYGSHPTYVDWSDAATGTVARNRSVCSSFTSHVLEKSFGYTPADIGAWFGVPVPQAREYHATIVAGDGFLRIHHIAAIRPGDIIAVAYPAGSRPTGHVMIAASQARPRDASAPLLPNTQQYEIDVIDSANSGHGPDDTRHRAGGGWTTGVGRGTLRFFGRPDDTIDGYAWSTSARSLFRPADVRRIAIGRLELARVPKPSGSPGGSSATTESAPAEDDAPFDDAS